MSNVPVTSFAEWVGQALRLVRNSSGRKIGLFDSSVPEPVSLLSELISQSFSGGAPASYQSVFMRNHPGLEHQLAARYDVAPEHILCTTGATMSVSHVLNATCVAGEHVIIERPGFDIFTDAASRIGLDVGYFKRSAPDFDLPIDEIIAGVTDRTRIVIVTDPHNPSGVSLPQGRLETLCRALAERGIQLLVDEVYGDYRERFDGGLDPAVFPNVVRIGSMTKNFGLSTLRCGWIFAGGSVGERILAELRQADFAVSKLSHTVAVEVFERVEKFDAFRRETMEAARPIMKAMLRKLEDRGLIVPGTRLEGCICFPQLIGVEDTRHFSEWLSERHDVVVVPGECFGEPGHIRIGFAIGAAALKEALDRLERGMLAFRDEQAGQQEIAVGTGR